LKLKRPKVQAVLQDPNLTPKEKKSKLKHIHAQSDPLVQSILNPTQYQQWPTIRKDEMENPGLKKWKGEPFSAPGAEFLSPVFSKAYRPIPWYRLETFENRGDIQL
jgi:hypothetical protein